MITLYHGSYIAVPSPLVGLGRKKVDFGQGFYLTTLYEQAKAWAETIAERKGRNTKPIVSAYTLDYSSVKNGCFRVKVFDSYDLEWLEYVIDCRRGGEIQKQYDIVEGGVANDNVIDTVEDYENDIITAEQALGQLRYKKVNHQLCILNQEIIDRYLTFKNSEIVSE